jgi:hypothetical protein
MGKSLFCLLAALIIVQSPRNRELALERILFENGSHEISGIAWKDGTLYAVADDAEDHCLYRVKESGSRFDLVEELNLLAVPGGQAYKDALDTMPDLDNASRRFDLEGVSMCGDEIYFANERARHILRMKDRTSLELLPVDLKAFQQLFEGGNNAGIEGVAADCLRKRLYIAKERSPRALMFVRMRDWKLMRVAEPVAAAGEAKGAPDFSDLSFYNGHLYAIERNTGDIIKLDSTRLVVLDRVSYRSTESGLYDTDEPYGLAEGLALTSKHIIIGLDNNGAPLSRTAQQKFGVADNPSAIMYFKRPRGF